ncbi:MAG: histone deacetylase [Deltaproteobacteria bacterium CG07_land_8_20_14_0_80_38_7]|nr:MAG: histone deacetylase [Deltaproteobacteria bacterium CG07_land_8_20_14_0_80_38_7]
MSKTGIIWNELFTKHSMGLGHPESPSRLLAIKQVLEGDGVGKEVINIKAEPASIDDLKLIHDESYINLVKQTNGVEFTYLDPDTSACPYTWDAALLAAGSGITLVKKVANNDLKNAFAFVRPPGHHAEKNRSMGFCIFNNIAIAAQYAKEHLGIKRIFIVDFDVHHGNGTQNFFYKNEDVFYFSIHRAPFFPGTGPKNETGNGKGKGTTLNIPLDHGADDDVYKRALEKHLVPAFESFEPEILLVSAGYDAHRRDPLGGMRLTNDGFRWIVNTLCELSNEVCNGKQVYMLEGGYDLTALRECVEISLEELVL